MSAELGQIALVLTVILAVIQMFVPFIGAQIGNRPMMNLGISIAKGQFLFISLALLLLTYSFVVSDFSVLYVASNSNTSLPLIYRITAVWGSHEGSFLLWMFFLQLWVFAVAVIGAKSLPREFVARVLSIMALISVGFGLFLLVTSNPFERLIPAAMEGRDLNPLLQDPGMIIHPPMLYMGYVGFSVAFSFAIAGLFEKKNRDDWIRWSRPWTNVAWSFLTFGIILGSWWAYYELGWGGWWFWDPVENASFMPWIAGTALLHAQAVTEKRGNFRSWTVLLAILAFSLSLLGTFLVRSGVLTSVHAFASDPTRGVFILAFLGIVAGSALLIYSWKAPTLPRGSGFSWFSRDGFLLIGNIFLSVTLLMVLFGTLYPLFADIMKLGKISVGPPYFGTMFPTLMAIVFLLLPLGPFMRWKKDEPERLLRFALIAFVSGMLGAALLAISDIPFTFYSVMGVVAGFWVVGGNLEYGYLRWVKSKTRWMGFKALPAGIVGMLLAHIGIGLFLMGVAVTEVGSIQLDERMGPGKQVDIAGYHFEYKGLQTIEGPNYRATQANIEVSKSGESVALLHPQKRIYTSGQSMTEADLDPGLFRDIYVAMGEPLGQTGDWAIRIYYKPMIRFIWLGGLFMMLGGFVAATDRRFVSLLNKQRKLNIQENKL
ncbi:MAG: heme lyase CcmF/NrfE family subunit [bacterium]